MAKGPALDNPAVELRRGVCGASGGEELAIDGVIALIFVIGYHR